jgi:hypothetical protein
LWPGLPVRGRARQQSVGAIVGLLNGSCRRTLPKGSPGEGELREAVNEAYDAGVIMVCAAGNIVNPVVAPARLNRTLAVGGVTAADVPWSGSSYGPETDRSSYADDLRRADVKRGPRFVCRGNALRPFARSLCRRRVCRRRGTLAPSERAFSTSNRCCSHLCRLGRPCRRHEPEVSSSSHSSLPSAMQ